MNLRKVLPLFAISALVLGGCSQKVSYADWIAKADEASKTNHGYNKADVSYSSVSEGKKVTSTCVMKFTSGILSGWTYESGDAVTGTAALIYLNAKANSQTNNEDAGYTYFFVGDGFQVIDNDEDSITTWTYESHGLMTSYVSGNESYYVSYN